MKSFYFVNRIKTDISPTTPVPSHPLCRDKLEEIKEQAAAIREYAGMYENAPPMKIDSLKGYRKFAEYGDTVLGGKYSEQYGFEFATWKHDKDRSYVVHGDYTTDYEYAKQTLAVRSGLVDETKIYDQKEAADIYAAIDFTRDNCSSLKYEQDERLKNHSEKMCDQGFDWKPYTKKLKRPAKMAYPTYLYVKIDCIRKRKNYKIKKLESCVILYSSSSQFCCAKSTFMIRVSF